MSSMLTRQQRNRYLVTALLPLILQQQLNENEENKRILDELGLLHLHPISDLAQQLNQQTSFLLNPAL